MTGIVEGSCIKKYSTSLKSEPTMDLPRFNFLSMFLYTMNRFLRKE